MSRKAIPKALRDEVRNRFGGRCGYCGEESRSIQIDHIEPVTYGGTNEPSNLMPACRSCNNYKLVWGLESFRRNLSEQVALCRRYSVNFRFAERYGLVQATEKPITFYFERVAQEGGGG